MNGKHQYAIDKVNEFERMLQTEIENLGLDQIDAHLRYNSDQIYAMTQEQLIAAAHEIQNNAYYVQEQINIKRVKADYLEKEIKSLVGHRLDQYQYMSTEAKWISAIKEDSAATELAQVRDNIRLFITRFDYLTQRMSDIAHTCMAMAKVKERQAYG